MKYYQNAVLDKKSLNCSGNSSLQFFISSSILFNSEPEAAGIRTDRSSVFVWFLLSSLITRVIIFTSSFESTSHPWVLRFIPIIFSHQKYLVIHWLFFVWNEDSTSYCLSGWSNSTKKISVAVMYGTKSTQVPNFKKNYLKLLTSLKWAKKADTIQSM